MASSRGMIYDVVVRENLQALVDEVNTRLADHWQLEGGICWDRMNRACQAMTWCAQPTPLKSVAKTKKTKDGL